MRSTASATWRARHAPRPTKRASEAETLRTELTRRLEKIEDERRQVLEKARKEAEEQLQELQEELREVRRALARARQPLEALEAVEEQVEICRRRSKRRSSAARRKSPGSRCGAPLRLGDKVRLRTLNMQGVVTSLGEEEAEVQVGTLRIRARLAELQLAGEPEASR